MVGILVFNGIRG